MRIQHNIMAMNAYRNYNNNTSALSKNLEKLSSGYKINRAGDDAAGLAISEKMRAQITGLEAAQKNVKDGISLVKTAEGAMQEIQDMLNRMDYLATQSANGTYDNEVDRLNLQKEVTALKDEINRISDSANFNGIKLLDGSLASESAIDKIEIKGADGLEFETSEAIKGKYTATYDLQDIDGSTFKEDDYIEYNVALSDGTSKSVKLTFAKEDNKDSSAYGALKYLVAEDGTKYDLSGDTGNYYGDKDNDGASYGTYDMGLTNSTLSKALAKELKKAGLDENFKVEVDANCKVTLTAREGGTNTPRVTAYDAKVFNGGTVQNIKDLNEGIDVEEIKAQNAGVEIKADSIVEYDGTNYDDAVFEINGHKFVLMTNTFDTTKEGTENNEYMRAVAALGKDVTVLVGGRGGLKSGAANTTAGGGTTGGAGVMNAGEATAADPANNNFVQNIKKIAEVTGLVVTDAIKENHADFGATAEDNGINAGEGIRLSIANTSKKDGGLTLQIGDTADDYNQMKVNVGDMHTKALGIDDLDISTQAGAQAAIQTVKDAINYVSGIRGDLGAVQNRLEHTQNNLSVMAENIQDAESTIRDTDVAEEMMSYVKNNILVQSAQAMLAQANQVPQGVLQLLG